MYYEFPVYRQKTHIRKKGKTTGKKGDFENSGERCGKHLF